MDIEFWIPLGKKRRLPLLLQWNCQLQIVERWVWETAMREMVKNMKGAEKQEREREGRGGEGEK